MLTEASRREVRKMIIRAFDGKTYVRLFDERLNLEMSDTFKIETMPVQEWDLEEGKTYQRTITIWAGVRDEGSAVVIVLEARTKEALEIKQA
jgi:hypothetical protein